MAHHGTRRWTQSRRQLREPSHASVTNRRPYADYTGHEPINSAYELRDPSRRQPPITTTGNGIFRVPQFVTRNGHSPPPSPIATPSPSTCYVPMPADRVATAALIRASANLTDYQRMSAELFNNKFASLRSLAGVTGRVRGLSLLQSAHFDFLINIERLAASSNPASPRPPTSFSALMPPGRTPTPHNPPAYPPKPSFPRFASSRSQRDGQSVCRRRPGESSADRPDFPSYPAGNVPS